MLLYVREALLSKEGVAVAKDVETAGENVVGSAGSSTASRGLRRWQALALGRKDSKRGVE